MPGKRFPPDDPREWLNRARSNLAKAKSAADAPDVYLEDLCFDAQQAAEKAVKAENYCRGNGIGKGVTKVREQYQPIIQALKQRFADQLKTVVLFGSQARGEAHRSSDHDLFIAIEALPTEPLARQRTVRNILLPILDDLPGAINFVAKTPEEVAANLTPLMLDICVDGFCLYGESYFQYYQKKALAALQQANLRRYKLGHTRMWLLPQLPRDDWELSWEGYHANT
jgi:predicted nucleotidyltransferase